MSAPEVPDPTREELLEKIHELSLKRIGAATERVEAARRATERDIRVHQAEGDLLSCELDYLDFRLREGLYSRASAAPKKGKA